MIPSRKHIAFLLLLALCAGSFLAPAAHVVHHLTLSLLPAVADAHPDVDGVVFDVECTRLHAPEPPCLLCTNSSLSAGVIEEPASHLGDATSYAGEPPFVTSTPHVDGTAIRGPPVAV